MPRSLTDMQDYAIGATDGDIGHVKDFYFDDNLSLNLTREAVKGAPPYDTSAHLNRDHAIGIFQHYGLPGYWTAEPTPEPVVAPL